MQGPLTFPNVTCSLVSLREPTEGFIVPRLALFVGETLPARIVNTMPFLETNEGEEGITPLYYISDVIPQEDNNVLVMFGIGHEAFEEVSVDDPDAEPWLVARYGAVIPLQHLLIARAMRLVDPQFMLLVCAEDPTPENLSKVRTESDSCIFAVDFPPDEFEETSARINAVLEKLSTSVYGSGVPHDDDPLNDHISPEIRNAQYNLLNIICALRQGSIIGGWRLLDSFAERINAMASKDDEDSDPASDAPDDHEIRAFVHLARMAYLTSTPGRDSDPTPEMLEDADPDDLVMSNFAKIMAFNDLEDVLNSVDDTNPYYLGTSSVDTLGLLDPFDKGIPTEMRELMDHIAQTEPVVLELVRWDWARSEVRTMGFNNHSMSDIVKAMLLVIAARLNMLTNAFPNQRKIVGTVRFLTSHEDAYPWEILAMRDALVHYETGNFIDLLETTYSEDDDDAQAAMYLFVILLQIKRRLEEEDWDASNLDLRLNSIDVRLRSLPDMRSLISVLLEEGLADEDETEVPEELASVMAATHTFDLKFLARNTSLLVPTMADIAAAHKELEVGTVEWDEFRREYINELLRSAAYGFSRHGLGVF